MQIEGFTALQGVKFPFGVAYRDLIVDYLSGWAAYKSWCVPLDFEVTVFGASADVAGGAWLGDLRVGRKGQELFLFLCLILLPILALQIDQLHLCASLGTLATLILLLHAELIVFARRQSH